MKILNSHQNCMLDIMILAQMVLQIAALLNKEGR